MSASLSDVDDVYRFDTVAKVLNVSWLLDGNERGFSIYKFKMDNLREHIFISIQLISENFLNIVHTKWAKSKETYSFYFLFSSLVLLQIGHSFHPQRTRKRKHRKTVTFFFILKYF